MRHARLRRMGLSYLKIAYMTGVNAARNLMSYDYFARDLSDQTQARNKMAKAFPEIIEAER